MSENKINVVGVCGKEAHVYGPLDEKTRVRPFLYTNMHSTYGAALLWAQEYEEKQRNSTMKGNK